MVYVYATIAGASDLLSGWFALGVRADKIQPRYVIAFASGVLLAVTFFEILPQANLKSDALFLGLGFITFYVLEKLVMIHACGESECETHEIGPVAVLGMALDNVVDGAGITVGYIIDPLLGLAITIAVVFHEIPQGMASALIMREAKFQEKMLAFIAGDFIYIGAGDLLPEAHRRFNLKVILSVIAGMAFVLTLRFLVPGI